MVVGHVGVPGGFLVTEQTAEGDEVGLIDLLAAPGRQSQVTLPVIASPPASFWAHKSAVFLSSDGAPATSNAEPQINGLMARTVSGDPFPGVLAEEQIEHKRRGKRPVDNQSRVTLHYPRVGKVVVDAVAVEGQGRVAEQKSRIGIDGPSPWCLGRRRFLRRGRCAGGGIIPINQILFLDQRQAGVTWRTSPSSSTTRMVSGPFVSVFPGSWKSTDAVSAVAHIPQRSARAHGKVSRRKHH